MNRAGSTSPNRAQSSTETFKGDSNGWTTCIDETTQQEYYWNTLTNEVTWENPYETKTSPLSRIALPGTQSQNGAHSSQQNSFHAKPPQQGHPYGSDIQGSHAHDVDFGGGRPHSSWSSEQSRWGESRHSNYHASSRLDRLFHKIDSMNASEDATGLPSSNFRPTLPTSNPSHAHSSRAIHAIPSYAGPSSVKPILASPKSNSPVPLSITPITTTTRSNNHFFDEGAYQDECNRRKVEIQDVGTETKKRKLTKKEVANFKARKEEQKKRKFMAKFNNM
jgi:hypothetical protein